MIRYSEILNDIDSNSDSFVQAHISNISFPNNIESLEVFIYEHGIFNIESILNGDGRVWTVPRNSKLGDIVLFFHAKTAISKITSLITSVCNLPDDSEHDKLYLLECLDRARQLYKLYGGKIFAVGRIVSPPEYIHIPSDDPYHFHGRIYADIGDIVCFDAPIAIEKFNSFITISRHSAITPLPLTEFNMLRDIIVSSNSNCPYYFAHAKVGCFDLSKVNRINYFFETKKFRRKFLYEADYRSYFVDYLLSDISNHKFYRECFCYTDEKVCGIVDNVFVYNGKYFLLEVKLNVSIERDLHRQLNQYVNADCINLNKKQDTVIYEFERNYMYVIDTNMFYIYDVNKQLLQELLLIDNVTTIDEFKAVLDINT